MEPIAIVTAVALLQYIYFTVNVGRARGKSGIKAPAMTGDPVFERTLRVQQNTLEQLVAFLPALWLFGYYVSPLIGAGLGAGFIVGRFVYATGYVADPSRRGAGFLIGILALFALLLGGLAGALFQFLAAKPPV